MLYKPTLVLFYYDCPFDVLDAIRKLVYDSAFSPSPG